MMRRNESGLDRGVRVVLGLLLFYLAVTAAGGFWGSLIFGILAVILIVTAVTGYCLLYGLLGINTCSLKHTEHK